MRSISSATSSGVPSDSQSKIATASKSYPALTNSSTALVVAWSIISKPAGIMPAAMMAATALPPFSISSKLAMMTRANFGLATNFTVTSVTTASMPSLPMTIASKSKPGESGARLPNSTISPFIKTPRTRSTLCRVRPYLRQCTPPEFSFTLPPIEQAIWDDGSGA